MNEIMRIDKDAQRYRKGIEELLKEKQIELDNKLKDMWGLFEEESKNIKNGMSNQKIIESENKAENIKKEKEEGLSNINNIYQRNKLEVIEIVFNKIIKPL